MAMHTLTTQQLKPLEPLSQLSDQSLDELARACFVERVERGVDPFRVRSLGSQAVYLLEGELRLTYADNRTEILAGGSRPSRQPIGRQAPPLREAEALTDLELVRIDVEVLDILMTWDQVLAAHRAADGVHMDAAHHADWSAMPGTFAAHSLAHGVFAALPPAHIDTLLRRFQRITVASGDEIVTEGEQGDYYYVIENGRCVVRRGGEHVAELKPGDAFGEEALVADTTRNATVIMKTDGVLLRLAKRDFDDLLKQPLLQAVGLEEARMRAANGAVWLDVRLPGEIAEAGIPGALNIPLNELRKRFDSLDRNRDYIVCCNSGRRSSAAAFLLAQRGYHAAWLEGGLRAG